MIGRPPKRPEDRLTETLHIRVTKAQLDRIQVNAIKRGLSVNQFILFCVDKTQSVR